MPDCVFCEIIEKKRPASIVYEDETVMAFMDYYPINAGHVLVVCKHHYSGLGETPQSVLSDMMQLVFRIERSLWLSELSCEGSNILHSHGKAAGQDVFHTHFHIVPRFVGDGFDIGSGTKAINRIVLDDAAKAIIKGLSLVVFVFGLAAYSF